MKTTIRIQVLNTRQLPLMEELNARFPEGIYRIADGRITAFIIEGDKADANIREIITYIENKNYILTNSIRDYSKQVSAHETFLYDKSDLDSAEYLNIVCKKGDGARSGRGDIINGRAQIEFPPHKFRYCISQCVFLINSAVKSKLEKEAFIGPIFLPVDHAEDELTDLKTFENLFALYSSVQLPPPAGWNEFREDTYDRSKLETHLPFDLALTVDAPGLSDTVRGLVCSQRFYRFWEANFRDAEYVPVRVRDDESVELKTPYQGES